MHIKINEGFDIKAIVMETAIKTKKYKVLGFSDTQCYCDVCGKTELHGTYELLDEENQEVVRAGTTCGARLMSIKNTEFIKIVDAAKKERQKVAFAEVRSSKEYIEYQNAITAMEGKGLTPAQRMEILHPLHDKVVSLSRDLQLKYDVEIPRYL